MRAPILMPEPNRVRFLEGFVGIRDGDRVAALPDAARLCTGLVEMARGALDLDLAETGDAGSARLVFEAFDSRGAGTARAMRELGCEPASGPPAAESYLLSAGPDSITISASDARGFFCAAQTLRQLVVERRLDRRRQSIVKRALIHDWPHARLRGLHLYLPAREHLPFCRRLIEGIAGLKYNRVYFEVSAMEYRRHPEINEAWQEYARDMDEFPEKAKLYQNASHCVERPWYKDSIHIENGGGRFLTQDEVRGLVRCCRANHLEVVPEVQSLSHCDYLVIPHREIAELPADPYPDCYCPSNPRSYELLFDVIDEVLEVFEPSTVNIGHDEWYSVGYCPACRGKDPAELLAGDVTQIHDHLSSRGVRTEMWGDKLLDAHSPDGRGQGGAERIIENYSTSEVYGILPATCRAVELIPEDVAVGNWYWAIDPGGFDLYARHGIQQSAFFNFVGPDVKDWHRLSRGPGVVGGSVSHWDLCELENMAREGTLTNIVYSSFPLWNERYGNTSWEKVRDLTIEAMPAFMEILEGRQPPGRSWRAADSLAVWLRHEKRDELYMDCPAVELRSYRNVVIQHRGSAGYHRKATVTEVEQPQSFRIAVLGDRVHSLVFTHATTISIPWRSADHGYRLEDYLIGHYTVQYEDGSAERIELSYGSNIAGRDAHWGRQTLDCSYSADIRLLQAACRMRPWLRTLDSGETVTVYDWEWVNPWPDKEIRDISLTLRAKGVPYSIFVYEIHGIRLRG